MKIMFLVAASLCVAPAGPAQGRSMPDRCKPMDVMMGAYKAAPITPDRSTDGVILPKAQNDSRAPAVLAPNCRAVEKKRRRKNDYPMA